MTKELNPLDAAKIAMADVEKELRDMIESYPTQIKASEALGIPQNQISTFLNPKEGRKWSYERMIKHLERIKGGQQ